VGEWVKVLSGDDNAAQETRYSWSRYPSTSGDVVRCDGFTRSPPRGVSV